VYISLGRNFIQNTLECNVEPWTTSLQQFSKATPQVIMSFCFIHHRVHFMMMGLYTPSLLPAS